ncbi:MAG: glycoside hydrolase family 43 protein [Solobacterium sp.]|nr:glycoside hydrolase family 43 protein [Solobacterium sp.]
MKKSVLVVITALLLISCTANNVQPKGDPRSRVISQAERILDPFLNDGQTLPSELEDGIPVTWSVAEGHAYIEDGVIHKSEDAAEYEPIVLISTVDDVKEKHDDLVLLDPYVAYVITYFGSDEETMRMMYTYDGQYWFKFNNDETIVRATIGTKRLRDPSLIRKTDGTFWLVATQGYDTDSVYVFDTPDLVTYTNEHLLKVNRSGYKTEMSGLQAWAPEGFYDRIQNKYILTFSSVADHGMYYVTTLDMNTCSYPKRLLDTGFDVIDGTIVKTGLDYTIYLKDERQPMEEYSRLFRGHGDNWDHFTEFEEHFGNYQSEGPSVMKKLDGDGWYLIYDDYTRKQMQILYTDDIQHGEFRLIPFWDSMIPAVEPAHGSAMAVTWKELERLMNAYEH